MCRMVESVVYGRDNEVIPSLIGLHSVSNPLILDVTFNAGKMWKGLNYAVKTMDIDPKHGTDYVGDFRDLSFIQERFDIVAFDPPHLPTNSASEHSSRIWEDTYGLTNDKDAGRDGDNVSPMFYPFLASARNVLKSGGIVIAKIADIIHNHKYQWQHVDFINSAIRAGMTPCDMIVKRDPCGGNLKSSKWINQYHTKRVHSYWIVVRNSNRCEKGKHD